MWSLDMDLEGTVIRVCLQRNYSPADEINGNKFGRTAIAAMKLQLCPPGGWLALREKNNQERTLNFMHGDKWVPRELGDSFASVLLRCGQFCFGRQHWQLLNNVDIIFPINNLVQKIIHIDSS